MTKSKKKKIADGFYIEALDRAHIIACNVEDYLLQHPAIDNTPKLKKKVQKISDLLGSLYQDIGNINTDKLK